MSEWQHTDERGRPVFDDDRLLAWALGLDDDPELEASARQDNALRRRGDAVQADVAVLREQLDAAVPDPNESYADPADPRWSGLRDYFAAPSEKATRSRTSRWLRVLAPAAAAAVVIAAGAGIIASQMGPGGGTAGDAGGGTAGIEKSRQPADCGSAEPGLVWSGTGDEQKDLETQRTSSLAKQAERFTVVVVARAAKAVGDVQRFTVVRELKGHADDVLRLDVVTRPAKSGALHLLFLDPLTSPEPAATAISPATPQAANDSEKSAITSPSTDQAPSSAGSSSPATTTAPSPGRTVTVLPGPLAFRFAGAKAIVRRLPQGYDVTELRLP
jgi:hypothetical protein